MEEQKQEEKQNGQESQKEEMRRILVKIFSYVKK